MLRYKTISQSINKNFRVQSRAPVIWGLFMCVDWQLNCDRFYLQKKQRKKSSQYLQSMVVQKQQMTYTVTKMSWWTKYSYPEWQ